MEKRETAIITAFNACQDVVKTALNTRLSALKTAWANAAADDATSANVDNSL